MKRFYDALKPLKKEIEESLLQKGIPEKALRYIADLIAEYSVIEKENGKVVVKIGKKELEGFLAPNIISVLPETLEIDFDHRYLIGMAIRDEKEKQMSKMDELIKEIEAVHNMREEREITEETSRAIEKLLYTDKIPEELKYEIIERVEKLNEKIKKLDKRIHISTEKFYKDPLTGFFSNKFYDEFFSDSVIMKRKEDVPLYRAFLKNILKINDKAVMFVDFANFKMINEIIGHNEADKILSSFAKMFENDNSVIPVRRGGDEFVFVAEKGTLERYKRKMEDFSYITFLNGEELIKKGVFTFPSAGMASLKEIDKFNEKNIDSLEKVNFVKKHISYIVKKAEISSNENKIFLKLKYNQPLSRDEGLKKAREIKEIGL